jgi:hypothetical protein
VTKPQRPTHYDSFQAAWDDVPRGDWLLWIVAHGADISDAAFLACARECQEVIIADCRLGGCAYIRDETTEPWPLDVRTELAVSVTTPYEHGSLEEKMQTRKRLADVVRSHFPQPPELPK